MKFQSHMPNFMDFEPNIPLQEFKSIDELLAHPWIKKWERPERKDFKYVWDANDGKWSKACLMATWIENDKPTWYVLGYMDEIPKELSKMEYPKGGSEA